MVSVMHSVALAAMRMIGWTLMRMLVMGGMTSMDWTVITMAAVGGANKRRQRLALAQVAQHDCPQVNA